MGKEKGITLIALVITIIVMLILVIVTVNIAMNGDLFNKAKNASEGTEKQAIKETILGSYVFITDGDNIGGIDLKETAKAAKTALENEGKTVVVSPAIDSITDDTEIVFLTVTGGTGTYYYSISGTTTKEYTETKDGEGNKTITDGTNTYTVNDDGTVVATGGTPWYILRDGEKNELRNKNKATTITAEMAQQTGLPEGGEIFTIASDGQLSIQYVEMTSPAEFVFLNMNNIYVYMGADETNAAILEEYYTPNAWLYDMNTVYTGSCPMRLYNMMYHKDEYCFCEMYLKRIIEHFGTPSWYEINSQEEFNELAQKNAIAIGNDGGDGAIIASDIGRNEANFDSRQNDYIIWYDNAMIAVNINGIGKYIYVTNKEKFSEEMSYKWFRFPDDSDDMSDLTESAAPTITGNEFTTIYSQSYLNRLLDHI